MTEIVLREQKPYELTEKQVTVIANTEFVPADKRGKLDVIWAAIFKGRSIGIDDMSAINEIHIVNGKPGLSAALAAGIVRKRGHLIDGELSPTRAVAHGKRGDNGAEFTVEFTIEQATKAGLAGKGVWEKYPASMLWARAVTQLCRSLFSDCFIGGVYTPEELGADFAPDDDVVEAAADEVSDEPWSDQVNLAVGDTDIELGLQDAPPTHPVGTPAEPSSASVAAVDAEPAGDSQQAGAGAPEATVPAPAAGLSTLLPPDVQAQLAGDHVIPSGKYQGKTVRDVHAADDMRWFRMMLAAKDSPTRREVETYVRANLPELLT